MKLPLRLELQNSFNEITIIFMVSKSPPANEVWGKVIFSHRRGRGLYLAA